VPNADDSIVTRNSCVVCAPLGATLAFAGVRKGMTILHGSQGCATYIRRYVISHFREPLDAASSSFTEESAVFGGRINLRLAYENVIREYRPELVGVATTCLAETIGEGASSVRGALRDLLTEGSPLLAAVSTPSYRGDQSEGFKRALRAIVEAACPSVSASGESSARSDGPVAVFPSMLSPADLRCLKGAFEAFGLDAVLVSDYSDTMDGGPWREERLLPEGGTPVSELSRLGSARCAIEFGAPAMGSAAADASGAAYLESACGSRRAPLGLPIGVKATDGLMRLLSELSGNRVPPSLIAERERLLDSYVDAHKLLFGRRALLYGDPDIVAALAGFCEEVGLVAVVAEGEGRDFSAAEAAAARSEAEGHPIDLLIGSSKGYKTAKRLGAGLVRVGFPIHDRFGGQRARLLSYGGTQELFDRVVNAIIERKQEDSDVGYTYY
jgi:nitrogenase molybdenum-iron protein NifN